MAQLTPEQMDWSLCIATLNREDALLRTLEFAMGQTCPPRQIVIVDVSDNWQEIREKAKALLSVAPQIQLDYITSDIRSSATQRNLGLGLCTSDIVFMLDDDSFMFPDCAAEILRVYAADTDHKVAAVCAGLVGELPPINDSTATALPARKQSGRRQSSLAYKLLHTKLGLWINRKILLQNKDELFIKYDEPRHVQIPDHLNALEIIPQNFMPGSAMTVRRKVALDEPFDPSLRYYAAFEDLDVAYRYARHGLVLQALPAKIHHYEAQGGRVKRKKLVIFQMLNMLIFLKRHAARPEAFLWRYRVLMLRRMVGEGIKDFLARRWDFPQLRGVFVVMREWRKVWNTDLDALDQWYPEFQKRILDEL